MGNTEKGKLEKELEDLEKVRIEKEELSKRIKELTIKVDNMDKESIKRVVNEEMLKDELSTKDNTIMELTSKIQSLQDDTKQDMDKRAEDELNNKNHISSTNKELEDLKSEVMRLKTKLQEEEAEKETIIKEKDTVIEEKETVIKEKETVIK